MMIHKDFYNEEDDINENATILAMNKITQLGASKLTNMLIKRVTIIWRKRRLKRLQLTVQRSAGWGSMQDKTRCL